MSIHPVSRSVAFGFVMAVLAAVVLVLAPDASAAAAGNDVGRNLGGLLRGYAGQIYGGVVAIVGLVFLINRRYTELAMFILAAVMVAWLVFSPDQIADAAKAIGKQVFG
jgi:nitrate reductase gamma subunit